MTTNLDNSDSEPSEAPHTDSNAEITAYRSVCGARVAVIERVYFRGAEFGGAFELADDPICYVGITPKLKVRMSWYGRTPQSGVCEITPLSAVLFEGDFSGRVVADVGNAVGK